MLRLELWPQKRICLVLIEVGDEDPAHMPEALTTLPDQACKQSATIALTVGEPNRSTQPAAYATSTSDSEFRETDFELRMH